MANKTLKSFIADSGIDASLIRAVIRQIGGWSDAQSSLFDVANYGAGGGFCGFTYYRDTIEFFNSNRSAIVALVESQASAFGTDPAEMVSAFPCIALHCVDGTDSDIRRAIYRALAGERMRIDNNAETRVGNALSWFALEEVARSFDYWSDGK